MVQIELLAGRTVGEYQIERLLGQSQLGAAYLALQPALGRKVMVTTFHIPEGLSAQEQEQIQHRISREGETLARLAHPNILPVYGCGVQPGYVYLITAFAKEASLNQLLKQNARFSPQHVLPMLKQVAEALDYARSQGVFHGMLSLSNVIVSDELNLRVAGFGLKSILEMYGNAQHTRPLDHLSPTSGAFLGDPEYISPERVLGLAVDGRADIYALGVILFALLSGTQPFRGAQPLDTAIQRLQQPAPSLHAACPDVPEALDIVIGKMLERDPARRTQYAGEAALAFERALKSLDIAQSPASGNLSADGWQNAQITMPPTVNWFDEAVGISSNILQASLPAGGNGRPLDTSFQEVEPFPQAGRQPVSLGETDPFLWWSSASTGFQAPQTRVPGTFASRPGPGSRNSRGPLRSRRVQQDRRRLVKLIVVGSAAAGVVTIGGMSLARLAQSQKQSLSQMATTSQPGSTATSGSTATASKGTPAPGSKPGATSTPASAKPPTPQPTSGKPSPTAQPKPTQPPPTPTPGHTGTVIGHTNQATNSAVAFTNPANGHASLLIRMANGNFVACEKACTHAGVPCDYNAGSQKLVCPAHGATFDPANGFSPTSPAPSPLPRVSIRVNADGTITTG